MSPRRIYSLFLRQVILNTQSYGRWFGLFYWPTIDLLVWGTLSVYLNQGVGTEFNVFGYLFGSIIFLNFVWRVQQGVAVSFLEDIWSQNFINLFASPLTLGEYILSLISTSIVKVVASISVMALLAWVLYAFNVFVLGFYLLPFIFILFFLALAIGFFGVGVTLRIGPSAEALVWAMPAILAPLSGVYYPITILPVFWQKVALAVPSTYVFDGMREVINIGLFRTDLLLLGAGLSLLYFVISILFLYRTYRVVLRKGLIARFSASD
ncbi:MAG: ABC transporter permease [Patescibacteria group bacterium]